MPEDGYELWGGSSQKSGWDRYWVVQKDLPMFVMAGNVIPLHDSRDSMSAMDARQEPLTLVIALKCVDVTTGISPRAATCKAQGTFAISKMFYWIFTADQKKVLFLKIYIQYKKTFFFTIGDLVIFNATSTITDV